MDTQNHLAAYGWVDGNPVHFLTLADSTATTEVKQRIGNRIEKERAPGEKNTTRIWCMQSVNMISFAIPSLFQSVMVLKYIMSKLPWVYWIWPL